MKREELKRMVGAGVVAAVVIACGGPAMEMLSDSMVDGGADVLADAMAQPECGNCTVGGALRIMTADTDPSRMLQGVVDSGDEDEPVVEGPFILTDVTFERENSVDVLITDVGTNCLNDGFVDVDSGHAPMHGGRFFVPAGKAICFNVSVGDVYWAGFRPYD